MSEFVMDDAEKSRLEDKARADAIAGVYVTPFDLINGSAKDKERKTEENRVYAAAHGAVPSVGAFRAAGAALDAGESIARTEDDIEALRSLYEEQFSKPADKRKSAATLKEELGL